MKESDRRVRRTKKLLKEALAKLLAQKSIRYITVRELTELADVSRGSFYTHYADIYDLFEHMENDLCEEIRELLVIDPTHSYADLFSSVINYVYENASVCRIFLCKGHDSSFRDSLADLFEEKILDIVKYEMECSEAKEDWIYLCRYQCYGIISLLSLWIDDGFTYPKEKLLELFMKTDDSLDHLYV